MTGAIRPTPALAEKPWAAWAAPWRATLVLIVAITLARLAYIAFFCPYALVEDEAAYWDWSRRLALSYYTKGPGVAWTIAAGVWLFGDTELGVRAPAVIFGGVLALLVAGLARDMSRDGRVGFFAAACVFLTPVFIATGLLMTIDGPYAACWAAAAWAAWRAIERRSGPAWIALGAAVGVGFLYKYTILLILPGIIAYAVLRRRRIGLDASLAPTRWRWLVLGVCAMLVGMSPVIIWNSWEGWPTVRHLMGHLKLAGGDMPLASGGAPWHPKWTLEFIAIQVGLLAPVIALMILGPMTSTTGSSMTGEAARRGRLFAWLCAAPVVLFYVGVTFFAEAEGNWAMAGYVTLLPLAGWAVVDGMTDFARRVREWRALPEPRPKLGVLRRRPDTVRQVAWEFALVSGVIISLAMLRLDVLAQIPTLGRAVPMGRLTGARIVAADAHRIAQELKDQTGKEPFYIAQHYGRAALLAFYIPGNPRVYCSSSLMNGRVTQYDFWADTDLSDLAVLGGRPAVLIGATPEQWGEGFARVVDLGPLAGEHKQNISAFAGYDYRGFPLALERRGGSR